jgi:hydroxymethylbilane synthase
MKTLLAIGSRGSKLALWQAEWVRARLTAFHPQLEVSIEIIKTTGDVLVKKSLTEIGGKGVFTKEIEDALLDHRIDLAVHSLKDLPTTLAGGLALAAITEREDPRDALVIRTGFAPAERSLAGLPAGTTIGTSSPRRLAQLRNVRPDFKTKELRGNVDTRLRKLDAGEYDAVILASAGLRRLGFADRISACLPIETMLPAVGQGALGIETRNDDEDTRALLAVLDHVPTVAACKAERALLRSLGGGCELPIAANGVVINQRLELAGLVASPSGDRIVRDSLAGEIRDAERIGERLATRLNERGAGALLTGQYRER